MRCSALRMQVVPSGADSVVAALPMPYAVSTRAGDKDKAAVTMLYLRAVGFLASRVRRDKAPASTVRVNEGSRLSGHLLETVTKTADTRDADAMHTSIIRLPGAKKNDTRTR